MKFDPTKHRILMGHLEEVEKVMLGSGCTYDEAASVVADLSFQIDKMMSEMGDEISESDEIAILRQLDSPGAYAQESSPRREGGHFNDPKEEDFLAGEEKSSSSEERKQRSRSWLVWSVFGVLLLLIGIFVFWIIGEKNQIIYADETVESSYAQIETVLQRRFDLIPNLVSTVKGYAKQENEIFLEIARLRTKWGTASTAAERVDTANELEVKLSQVIHLTETYPELRSSEQFSQLQYQLEATENRISVERNRYNSALRNYNSRVRRFPGSLFQFEPRDAYFKAVSGAETVPSVSF